MLLKDIGDAIDDDSLRNITPERLQQILKTMDLDKSGEIDKQEFLKFMLNK